MTLSSQKKLELLVVFNVFATLYIFLHKTFVPGIVFLFRDSAAPINPVSHFGFWWVYHALLWWLLVKEKERGREKIQIATSVGMALLLLFFALELKFGNLLKKLDWKGVSNTLSYGTSFLLSAFIWSHFHALKKKR